MIPDRHPVVVTSLPPCSDDSLGTAIRSQHPPPDAISLLVQAIEEAVVMNQVAVPRFSSPSRTYRQRSVSYSLTRVFRASSVIFYFEQGVLHIDGFFVFVLFFEKSHILGDFCVSGVLDCRIVGSRIHSHRLETQTRCGSGTALKPGIGYIIRQYTPEGRVYRLTYKPVACFSWAPQSYCLSVTCKQEIVSPPLFFVFCFFSKTSYVSAGMQTVVSLSWESVNWTPTPDRTSSGTAHESITTLLFLPSHWGFSRPCHPRTVLLSSLPFHKGDRMG